MFHQTAVISGKKRRVLAGSVVLALAAASCGSSGSGDQSSSAATTSAAATTTSGSGTDGTTAVPPSTEAGSDTTTGGAPAPVGPDMSDCPAYDGRGLTDTEVVFGGSAPLSGPVAAAANTWMGSDAYFEYINSQGGVTMKDGKTRQLRLKMLDDMYQAPNTKANVDELINVDGVFALFNVFGSVGNVTISDDITEACIPSVFQQVGDSTLSGPKHPWFLVGLPPYAQEARALADYLKTIKPDAKVAILYQNDGVGTNSRDGFKEAIKGTDITIVAEESYEVTDPDVTAQMTTLAASKADVFLAAALSTKCVQAFNEAQAHGWDPIKLGMITCGSVDLLTTADSGATDGLLQAQYKKEVRTNASDPAIALYLEWFEKTHSGQDPFAGVAGWAYGQWIQQVLENMPENTRQSFIATAGSMTYSSDMFYDGISQQTNAAAGDYYPLEGFQILQLDVATKTLNPVDPPVVVDYNGEYPLS